MARLLIDGYNLLPATDFSDRDKFIAALARYKKEKGHEITVVFDGTHQGTGSGDRIFSSGVEVLFTPITVQADDVIEEMLEKPRAGEWTVVSSDRRVQSAARKAKATFISSQEFARKLQAFKTTEPRAQKPMEPWMEGREEDFGHRPHTGNTKKLSKEDRKRKKRMEKL